MPPSKPNNKLYFFYGHRKPTQNRPTVQGGLFSNRRTVKPTTNERPTKNSFDLQKWDPDSPRALSSTQSTKTPSEQFFSESQNLSPIARYIVDTFRRHNHNWGPPLVQDLNKLRRVTPKLVAEVLKVQGDPRLSSKFFHWAGNQNIYSFFFFNTFFLKK